MYREIQGRYFLSPEYPSQCMLRLLHVSLALFEKKILMMNFFYKAKVTKEQIDRPVASHQVSLFESLSTPVCSVGILRPIYELTVFAFN